MSAFAPLLAIVLPTARDRRVARKVVDSHPVISAYASCGWDELDDNGREWMAAVVRKAQVRAALTADTIVRINAFLTHMAERFRERTSRRFLGLRVNMMQPMEAMSYALATFDNSLDMLGVAFGDPEYGRDRDHAYEMVDEEFRHWEG